MDKSKIISINKLTENTDPIDNFVSKLSKAFDCSKIDAFRKFIRTTGMSYKQLNNSLIRKSKENK
ncbi:MAG: hypothetical protein M1168_03540 [Candidatus Marsarchaeota archaeon]|nr:hypothetical protein [Candidatus Marsarchaeota archaeon]MCL5095026.1 hypothetical protein [Candidatus Marsarchaeota archaeon]